MKKSTVTDGNESWINVQIYSKSIYLISELLGLKNRNEKLTNSSMKQGYQYQEHQNHKFGM